MSKLWKIHQKWVRCYVSINPTYCTVNSVSAAELIYDQSRDFMLFPQNWNNTGRGWIRGWIRYWESRTRCTNLHRNFLEVTYLHLLMYVNGGRYVQTVLEEGERSVHIHPSFRFQPPNSVSGTYICMQMWWERCTEVKVCFFTLAHLNQSVWLISSKRKNHCHFGVNHQLSSIKLLSDIYSRSPDWDVPAICVLFIPPVINFVDKFRQECNLFITVWSVYFRYMRKTR